MRILGIDPGSRNCGLAIVDTDRMLLLASQAVKLPGLDGESLQAWAWFLEEWMLRWRVSRVSMESVFFNQNVSSAVRVGEARGVALLLARQHHATCCSYTPQQAKKTLTGRGNAQKDDIQKAIHGLFGQSHRSQHANDAASLAVCDAVNAKIIRTYWLDPKEETPC